MSEGTIFTKSRCGRKGIDLPALDVPPVDPAAVFGAGSLRSAPAGLPEVSEAQAVRHFVNLSSKNYHVDKGMYPLGSCTMKYNPKMNEDLARLPGFTGLHPLAPEELCGGALQLMDELGRFLCEITGFEGISLQPAAGAHGELTGLLLIRNWHLERGDTARVEILMPDSAHGTNPASCTLAGFRTVNVKSNSRGEVDIDDLRAKAGPATAGLMLTNPNTLGIFESGIEEITRIVHDAGGLCYMDGANMNAMLGIARPGDMGFDVCHLNLHKTFSAPHGGGGPGSGPVACRDFLARYLPDPVVTRTGDGGPAMTRPERSFGRLLAFHGHFGVLVRAWAYIRTLGAAGLREASETALLNANYLKARLRDTYDVPYNDGPCMHEFVISGERQARAGVKTLDIAKRLLDYGFHAPTVYFPMIVHESMMIEPTETESLESLDAFVEAMLSIAREIDAKPHLVTDAPVNTPVLRLDEVRAVKELEIVEKWENS
ncbi:MAG TPA: aminomethyl-transferring glycine dehydrogenase subunit GcvPB [Candidatus Fermentibacter daniensis]|nr:aminomethyl-transferring glycine dehydrogenase subunit GcvPB [Candidatus Fermentibacter daniensis]HOR07616.1 aminomethyl-transferring glycine dehydrogenase subunit GcvPB [Candidatus Fermentibacter daniensis]HPK51538.1 aminomethyl-transferring glycine dehydrogenase subunit GcvPB [Candidatus Fermentibacter daniensis]HQH92276.1 aminomethyl-transferring glycine dehydrogenase subunit GcvPB [Candidatus Fermentibacter daniensis]